MSADRFNADRGLYIEALYDAISWQESILVTHDPSVSNPVSSCCKPGARCEQYKIEAAKLARYRVALTRARTPRKDRKAGG